MNGTDKYEDIIDLPHHQSDRRAHMSRINRAAQFAPFAALTGYDDVIAEEGRLTDAFREMDESEKAKLDQVLRYLQAKQEEGPLVKVLYFLPDALKEGGSYVEAIGRFLKVDTYKRELVLEETPKEGEDASEGVGGFKFGIEIARIVKLWIRGDCGAWVEDPAMD
ncbi:MAG: hypothetical protein J6Z22_08400 [Lachnospiraceae bacterium]|nr:hypothetical protein [Lachnospiraceae bacterium]